MAQSGYSSYYPQTAYAYPTPPAQQQTPQAYDPRMQPHYPAHYQQPSYAQHPQQQAQQYGQPSAPLPRPPSRINPVPYAQQLNGPMTAPLPHPPHSVQYFPPRSPQPYNGQPSTNPYPSPVSPQTPQSGTPQSSRRPLPDPRGLPPPPPNGQPLPSPQPTPSPGPFVSNHRPTHSVPSAFPPNPPPNAVSRIPSGQGSPPTTSAFSTTSSTSPMRPLPLPRSMGSVDLSSSQSQPQPQLQSQSPPKRALPEPQSQLPSLPQQQQSVSSPEPLPVAGQRFVPLWKRALPQPGGSAIAAPEAQSSQAQAFVERRSTVSGVTRPLPSPSTINAVTTPKDQLVRTGTLPPHLQLQNTPSSSQQTQQSNQPPNPPPRAPRPAAAPTPSSMIVTSRFAARERSRTLPLPSAAPSYPPPPKPTAQSLASQQIAESPVSSDDEELTNALLERHPRSPSPQYGIRDLPRNNRPALDNGQVESGTHGQRELPSPGPPSPKQNEPGESSMAMRMASMSIRSTSPSPTFRPTHGHSNSMSNAGPSRPMPQPPSQAQSQQHNGWPAALPPLPRAPGSSSATSPPPTQSAFSQIQGRALPQPTRSNTTAAATSPFSRSRSPRKVDLDLSLDDAPPPSLRRSPGPPSSFSAQSQLPSAQAMGSRSQTTPSSMHLQRTPSDATSVFSLSNFPAPPSSQPTSPRKNAFTQPPPNRAERPPSPAKPQFSARSQSPVRFQPPPSPSRNQTTPRIPKISFPANADGDSDEDEGPVINISGPGESRGGASSPSIPRISFGDDDGVPSINIGGADDGPSIPQISLPGQPSSSPKKSQIHKMQETLSNPRLEAAKRSGLVCGGCGGAIIGRIVSAMDMRWHPGCFRCCVCDELLENLSSYAHEGRPYCHLDYHEVRLPLSHPCVLSARVYTDHTRRHPAIRAKVLPLPDGDRR